MLKKKDIVQYLKRQYFWDVDFKELDAEKSRRLIIERVFTLGTSEEIMLIVDYYGTETIIQVLTSLNYLDPKTLNFVSLYFNVPLPSFKCYIRRQSGRKCWTS